MPPSLGGITELPALHYSVLEGWVPCGSMPYDDHILSRIPLQRLSHPATYSWKE